MRLILEIALGTAIVVAVGLHKPGLAVIFLAALMWSLIRE